MIFTLLAQLIDLIAQLLILLILIWTILSWFVSPYNRVLQALDRLVGPMLAPIRSRLPPIGGFDFSPVILILLIWLINDVLQHILFIL
jgi:YggT family protein